MDTEMTETLGNEQRDQIARRSALRRLVDVKDVADTVASLLEDKSKSITGTVMIVDAGSPA
jgi:3-oxoacyl-[acyl-carrier protein] reductase